MIWQAIKYILQPAVLYPLMATLYDLSALKVLGKKFAILYCQALGINKHFPRAILYGPCQLGGLEIPSLQAMFSIIRINYFLYHTRSQTTVGEILEISVIYLQLEVGTIEHVLSSSYKQNNHLAMHSLIKCIWAEMQPFSLILQGNSSTAWTPHQVHTRSTAVESIYK